MEKCLLRTEEVQKLVLGVKELVHQEELYASAKSGIFSQSSFRGKEQNATFLLRNHCLQQTCRLNR